MKKIDNNEIKSRCLNILIAFDDLCKKNGLEYSLAYGTLIGAIRHKGFIPWDDDIDVIMPREDYERLLVSTVPENFKLYSYNYNEDYYYPFAKMTDVNTIMHEKLRMEKNIGIYIDIFPIDTFQSDNFDEIYEKNLVYLNKEWNYAGRSSNSKTKNIIKNVRHEIISIFKPNYIKQVLEKHNDYIGTIQCSKGRYSGNFSSRGYGKKELFSFDIFALGTIDTIFENHTFKIIKDYDRFLKQIYGDYMKLPPKEEQIGRHDMDGFVIK